MRHITGLIGREELIEKITREARKGRHLLLTGPPGIGKSTLLEAVIDRLIVRRDLIVLHVNEHQAKGQFLEIARGLLESGLLKPSALELDADLDALNPAAIEWAKIKRSVNRLSIRDLTAVTPTLVAFWLAILDAAQLITCASEKRKNVSRLWWKLAEIEIAPLSTDSAQEIAQTYLRETGMLVESPALFIAHVVQQANGNPQALADLLADSSKERVVDKQRIREMRHAAGVRYLDFTPVMIVALASIIGARYLAIGTGDTELYVFAGMLAAVVISIRVFLFRGAGKAN